MAETAAAAAAVEPAVPEPRLALSFGAITEKNIEQLKVLNRAIFPIKYPERMYKDVLAYTDVTQLAYHNDVLVGAIACRLEKAPQGPKLYILTLGVLAPYRGMGAGAALLQRCLQLVATQLPEVSEAVLHVQTSNDEAIRFYSRFGFEVAETIQGYYKRLDPPDAVLLRKVLRPGGGATTGGGA
ncbi:N-alpha-acetyltransferase 50 [Micractinium conductrix]|uniref:N-alpha-acetyltransferase 50 n=1 Tax=Micractinium conductrix TaxID=554055 RepID=A0A2P6V4M2_9CHLO|nr:N-alpha-acetyltransferase 50 [Micractinium conductrix]|eukprot:PSC69043.1 N-alpha-acetyltransferase 50 [Micractinium conductrix]